MKKHLIPAVLAFLFAFLLWQMQKDRVEMTYNVIDSDSFPLDSNFAKFFVIDLENSGNKEIENVMVKIDFGDCIIKKISYSDFNDAKFNQEISSILGNIKLFNPKEKIKIKCTVIGKNGTIKEFSARAKGVTASIESVIHIEDYIFPLGMVFLSIILSFYYLNNKQLSIDKVFKTINIENIERETIKLTSSVDEKLKQSEIKHLSAIEKIEDERKESQRKHDEQMAILDEERKERKQEREEYQKGKPERTQLIFSCLNQHKLTPLFFKILELGDGMTFLNTGFILFLEYLKDNNNNNCLKAMETLSAFDMAPTSQGMLFYLLGKMESKNHKYERVNYWLNKCKADYPILYDFLIENDENFDLEQLSSLIKKQRMQHTI